MELETSKAKRAGAWDDVGKFSKEIRELCQSESFQIILSDMAELRRVMVQDMARILRDIPRSAPSSNTRSEEI